MQSAVAIAEDAARAQMPEPSSNLAKGAAPTPTPNIKVETPGAIFESGKALLRGNPLQTTPEVICPHCRLPRLLYPIAGKGARDPDLSKQYCMLYPYVSKAGHDIYGVPFPTEQAKSKKERELIKQQERAAKDNTPGSQDTGTPPDGKASSFSLNTGTKAAGYIPWHTCPNCKRSLLITRFAQHLEKCLGISGRQSSRNAMAKLSGNGTGAGNTPNMSRVGTPVPGSQGGNGNGKKSPSKREQDGDEEDGKEASASAETPVKKKKKSNYIKKADRERMAAEAAKNAHAEKGKDKDKDKDKDKGTPTPTGIKIKLNAGSGSAAKRPPKEKGEKEGNGNGKRDRDEDGSEEPRKKMKTDDSDD